MPETRRNCPHCDQLVSLTTYRRHKMLYFDEAKNTWNRVDDTCLSSDSADSQMEEDIHTETEDLADSEIQDGHCGDSTSELWENVTREEVNDDIINNGSDDAGSASMDFNTTSEPIETEDHGKSPSGNIRSNQRPAADDEEKKLKEMVHTLVLLLCHWSSFYKVTDNCLNSLLKLLSFFFILVAQVLPQFRVIADVFPKSLYALNRDLGLSQDCFKKLVVCPKCHMIYNFEECFENIGTQKKLKKCTFVAFPEHRHASQRLQCGEPLLFEVILNDGSKKLYPRKVYCYKSIIETLKSFMQRPGFEYDCELWRKRNIPADGFADVYDGKVWKDFQYVNEHPFLASPNNLAFMLNIDWFQPFKHTQYSLGVIYLVIMNLPRSKRFKVENVVLVGLLPGPSEPPLHLNTYLQPLVEELQQLWNPGVCMFACDSGSTVIVRGALLCVVCDIPAIRKVCGFLGHSARMGCSKCVTEFRTTAFGQKANYGGFTADYQLRTEEEHRAQAQLSLRQVTQTTRDGIEKQFGTRFSILMLLSYFDCVRFQCFHGVNPMHNLFTGTAKHVMTKVWMKKDDPVISRASIVTVQDRIDHCKIPSTLGRIPRKIFSGFSSLTADEWKNWTTIFSIFSLYDLIEQEHLNCWRLFVSACRSFSTPLISLQEIDHGHESILRFCQEFERLYGSEQVTPNMHLHMHLADCLKDFGPVYGFWLFSFERYNGILGKFQTNNRSIEIQMMRKFVRDQAFRDLQLPLPTDTELPNFDFIGDCNVGTVGDMVVTESEESRKFASLSSLPVSASPSQLWIETEHFTACGSGRRYFLDCSEKTYLQQTYQQLYPDHADLDHSIPTAITKYSSIEFNGQIWGSEATRSQRSSYVLACWCDRDGGVDPNTTTLRPGIVSYFFKHYLKPPNSSHPMAHIFAYVRWFLPHPLKHTMGAPVEVWCSKLFEPSGAASFIPFQRIHSKFVAGFQDIEGENLLCVCPLGQKVFS